MLASAWPAGRILPQDKAVIPDTDEPDKYFRISGNKDRKGTDRKRPEQIIEGMRQKSAQDSRGLGKRRRQPLFGKQSTGEDHAERARRSRFRSTVSHHSSHLKR